MQVTESVEVISGTEAQIRQMETANFAAYRAIRDTLPSTQLENLLSGVSSTVLGTLFGLVSPSLASAASALSNIGSILSPNLRQLYQDEIFGGVLILRELDTLLRDNPEYIGIEVQVGFLTFSPPGESSTRLMRGNQNPSEGSDYVIRRIQTQAGWIDA